VNDDIWASLADQFVDEAYASVKGLARTYVLRQQLLEHLPPPAPVLDVGGGAGRAQQRLQRLPAEARDG
jgi:S-adenosylmethionine-dependent methyltransferase